MDKFKVIREYEEFYLAKSNNDYNECFNKTDVKVIDGYVIKKLKNYKGGKPTPKEKINKNFNSFESIKEDRKCQKKLFIK